MKGGHPRSLPFDLEKAMIPHSRGMGGSELADGWRRLQPKARGAGGEAGRTAVSVRRRADELLRNHEHAAEVLGGGDGDVSFAVRDHPELVEACGQGRSAVRHADIAAVRPGDL